MVAKQSPARGPYSRHFPQQTKHDLVADTRSPRYRNWDPFQLHSTSSEARPYSLCSTRFFARATAPYRKRTRATRHAHTNNSGPQHAHHRPQASSGIRGNNMAYVRPPTSILRYRQLCGPLGRKQARMLLSRICWPLSWSQPHRTPPSRPKHTSDDTIPQALRLSSPSTIRSFASPWDVYWSL